MSTDAPDNGMVCTDGVCYIDFSKRKNQASSSSATDIAKQVDDTIANNKVVVYSKTYCPYCDKSKDLFRSKGVEYLSIELDNVKDGEAMHTYLKDKTNQTTVPNIFVSGQHVGGCSDLLELNQNGELEKLLNQ